MTTSPHQGSGNPIDVAGQARVEAWMDTDELERNARALLEPKIYDWIAGGAGDDLTVLGNVTGFCDLRLRPRVFANTEGTVSSAVDVLGTALSIPLMLAPMGGLGAVHPDGERALAAGARTAGVGFILSAGSSFSLEAVAEVAGDARWFQLYFTPDAGINLDLVRRVEASNYRALCVTIDVPAQAYRRRDMRNRAVGAAVNVSFGNFTGYPQTALSPTRVTASDIAWLRSVTRLPLLVKGILAREDARIAVDAGADGVIVSNHGGRQLDQAISAIRALPAVVDEVGEDAVVLLDGGVRRSTEIAIAIAAGARAVSLGRPVLWALAVGGEQGVTRYLLGLAEHFEATLAQLGVSTVHGLDTSFIVPRPPSRAIAT